ncbi:MAG: LysR family transcriptional regulator [Sneathiella sp.]|nr:LysR family transcriptional regulator [Sneathiella sp.]
MKAFTLVAQSGSFAEAARKLNLTTSVISKRVKDLEAYLGTSLFHRTTRNVRLTDTGRSYLDYVRKFLDELEEVEDAIRHKTERPVGEIKLSAPLSFGIRYLGPALSNYLHNYPEVSIQTFLSDRKIDLVSEGYDLSVRIGPLQDSSLISKKLVTCRRVVCASPEYFAQHGRPQKPTDLVNHNCMKYTDSTEGKTWPFIVNGKMKRQIVSGRFSSDNGDLLCEAAVSGFGITYLPTFITGKAIQNGKLEVVLDEYEEKYFNINVLYQSHQHLSPKIRTLIDSLSCYFQQNL